MALEIGSGITIGGGISVQLEFPAPENPYLFTVGGTKTVSINTFYGASPRIEIITIGEQAILGSWMTSAQLTRASGSATIAIDYVNNIYDNGNGTWTYDFALKEYGGFTYPGDYSWDTMKVPDLSSGTTYAESAETFNGTFGPPWIVTSLYNTGTLFSIRTGGGPVSADFISAINALTAGSVIVLTDNNAGDVTIMLTSGFDGTCLSVGDQYLTASCSSFPASPGTLSQITTMTII